MTEKAQTSKLFTQIKEANESIKTIDLKGKEYSEVNQRVKAFRMVFPDGSIQTEIVSLENGVVVMKTSVTDGHGTLLATGYAYEKENSSFINKTSYIENCETSAVGRALGFCGFGIDTSICSAEELKNAKLNQVQNDEVKNGTFMSFIDEFLYEHQELTPRLFKKYKIQYIEQIKDLEKDTIDKMVTDIKKMAEKLKEQKNENQ